MRVPREVVFGGVLLLATSAVRTRPAASLPAITGECPHYWGKYYGGAPTDTLPIAGHSTNVPEYNDCQRFVVSKGPLAVGTEEFAAIQAVWVRENVAAYFNAASGAPVSPLGDAAHAPFTIGGALPPIVVPSPGTVKAGTVGLVYSEGAYKPLGIRRGWNCLFATWKLDAKNKVLENSYGGWMVPVDNPSMCDAKAIDTTATTAKRLVVTSIPPASRDSVPQVARWDWDKVTATQFVSLWCPTGWCEFRVAGAGSSPRYTTPMILTGVDRGVIREKGYYDQQFLALPSSGGNSIAKVAGRPVNGTIFPVPGLAGRKMVDYTQRWAQVAWVHLSEQSSPYLAKYLYDKDMPPPDNIKDAKVYSCYRPMAAATDTSCYSNGVAPPSDCHADDVHGGKWFMKIVSGSGTEKLYCVHYRHAPDGVRIPGVVRWRWSKKDDLIWFGCPQGCCEGDSKD